jgi:iron complex transport system substrate-binding protein
MPSVKPSEDRAVRTVTKPAHVNTSVNAEVAMPRFKVRLWFSIPLIAAVLVAGCGSTTATTTPSKPSAAGAASFPLEVVAANGTVTIPRQPSRIVSLSPTSTDDLYAVGAGKQVVAVDSYSTYPSQAPRTTLSGFTPNVEAIATYRPDLVLVSDDTNQIVEQLAKLQIPALVEPPAVDLTHAYAQIVQLAQVTGHAAEGGSVVASLKQKIAAIISSVPRPTKPITVYHELDQTYYSATSQTFIGQMYTLLGIQNIADKAAGTSDYPQLTAEYIVSSNPDLIVLADTVCCGQTAATVAARPGWDVIAAVKNGDVVPVDDSIASQWGTRIVLFLQAVANAERKIEGQR